MYRRQGFLAVAVTAFLVVVVAGVVYAVSVPVAVWAYGPSDSRADETQSGNVDDTTGSPIQLG